MFLKILYDKFCIIILVHNGVAEKYWIGQNTVDRKQE